MALDLLRGIAALAVALRHLPGRPVDSWLPGSYLAVDLFFGLSGFVLAHAYLNRLADGMTLRQFLKVRATRLYPLYALATAIGATVAAPAAIRTAADGGLLRWASSLLLNLMCLPAPKGLSFNTVNPFPFAFPAWSLFWELAVNVVFVLIALRLMAPVVGRRSLAALLVIGAAMLGASAWYYGSLDSGANLATFPGGGMRVVFSFFAGVGLYGVWRQGHLAALHAQLGAIAVPLSAALMMAAFMIDPGNHRALFDSVAALIVFPLVITMATAPLATPLQRPATVLGAASYPLYVLHLPLIMVAGSIGKVFGRPASTFDLPLLTAVIAVIFVISIGPAQWFDLRARKVLQQALVGGWRLQRQS